MPRGSGLCAQLADLKRRLAEEFRTACSSEEQELAWTVPIVALARAVGVSSLSPLAI